MRMKLSLSWLLVAALCLLSSPIPSAEAGPVPGEKAEAQVRAAIEAFEKADSSLKQRFDTAVGFAIFPSVGKGGLVFGGAHGSGWMYQAGRLVGSVSLTQVTFGAQIGGQEFSEVVFFENQEAVTRFQQSKVEMSAQVSAVAAAEGASQHAKYADGILVFTRPITGLMAEASIGGQKFKFKPLGSSGNTKK